MDVNLTSLPVQLSAHLQTLNQSITSRMSPPPRRERVSRLAASLPLLKTGGCLTVVNDIHQTVVPISDSIDNSQSCEATVREVLGGSAIGKKIDQHQTVFPMSDSIDNSQSCEATVTEVLCGSAVGKEMDQSEGKDIVQTAEQAEWQIAEIEGAETRVQQAEIGGGLSGEGLISILERLRERTDMNGGVGCMTSYPPIPSTAPHVSTIQELMKSEAATAASQILAAKSGNGLFSRNGYQSFEKIVENVDMLNQSEMMKDFEELVHTKPWIPDRIVGKPNNPLREGEMTPNLMYKHTGRNPGDHLSNDISCEESSVTPAPKTSTVSNHSECINTPVTLCIAAMATNASPCMRAGAVAPYSPSSGPASTVKKPRQSRIAALFSLQPRLSLDEHEIQNRI